MLFGEEPFMLTSLSLRFLLTDSLEYCDPGGATWLA